MVGGEKEDGEETKRMNENSWNNKKYIYCVSSFYP